MRKILALITTFFMCIAFVNVASADEIDISTYNNENYSQEQFQKALEHYLVLDTATGLKLFDTNKAINDNASDDFIFTGNLYNELLLAKNGIKNPEKTSLSLFYGRYCGPGHSGPGEPIDNLDRACRSHDRCYGKHGWGNKQCDRDFVATLKRLMPHLKGKALKYAGAAIAVFA